MKYHHIGIPTQDEKTWLKHLADAKVHVSDPAKDEFGIEWLKFAADSPMPAALKDGIHIAFVVDNLESAMAGKTVILPPFDAEPGVRCAFIDHEGLPVELMEVAGSKCDCACSH